MARPRRPGAGVTIGGILAGIDGQIFRSTPPAHELVRKGDAIRGVSGDDGDWLTIELPGAKPAATDEEHPAGERERAPDSGSDVASPK